MGWTTLKDQPQNGTTTKFIGFTTVDVKAVFDRQALMGTGPLPTWLRNLAHNARGRAMAALDTFQDNLCLWRCIAVSQGVRTDRSTVVARQFAARFFNTPHLQNCPKTSLDELDKVEQHFNTGKPFNEWLGIRVYEQERSETGEVLWHLKRNSPAKVKTFSQLAFLMDTHFLSKILKSWRNYMYVFIAKQDLPKLVVCKDTIKPVLKVKLY